MYIFDIACMSLVVLMRGKGHYLKTNMTNNIINISIFQTLVYINNTTQLYKT